MFLELEDLRKMTVLSTKMERTMILMSIHPRTPSRPWFGPRARLVAVGFMAALLSCSSSDQVGYDVKINLIPPTETNAQNPLPSIEVPVSLSPSNPMYSLGFVDYRWPAGLNREAARRGDGLPAGFDMSMDQFALTGDGTVDFVVRVLSQTGYISGRDRNYVPVSPPSCSFTLDPNTATGADYAQNINQCLSDWLVENGVPQQFDMEVTAFGASASAAAIKSGFATKATATNWGLSGMLLMAGPSECDAENDEEVLDAVKEGEDIFGLLDCRTLEVTGEGTTSVSAEITGRADIWDACDQHLSWAIMQRTEVPGGDYTIAPEGVTVDGMTAQVPVSFYEKDSKKFFNALNEAGLGNCAGGNTPEPGAEGRAVIQWTVCGQTPRTGTIGIVAEGTCSLSPGKAE